MLCAFYFLVTRRDKKTYIYIKSAFIRGGKFVL